MSIVLLQLPQKLANLYPFLIDLDTLLSFATTIRHEFLFIGDFNIHLDNPDDSPVKQFLCALDATNLTQHVSFPAHRDLHTLDLVIIASSSSLSPVIDHLPVSPSDHFHIFPTLTISLCLLLRCLGLYSLSDASNLSVYQ